MRSHLEASGVRLAPGADGAARTSTAQATIGEDRAATYVFDLDWNPPHPTLPDGQAPLLVHTGSIAAILAPGAATVEQVLRETRATSTIAYDPNARPQLMGEPEDAREVVERLVGLSDLVKCSDEDIAWLYGEGADLETVLRSWLEKGAAVVVVTRGKQGALALSASGVRLEVPADPSVVVADTVGAGDSFMGGSCVTPRPSPTSRSRGPEPTLPLATSFPEEPAARSSLGSPHARLLKPSNARPQARLRG